jgi:hypothetical protein
MAEKPESTGDSHSDFGRGAGGIMLGAGAGLAGGFLGMFVGGALGCIPLGCEGAGNWNFLYGGIAGATAGYGLGAAVGVYAVGQHDGADGSFKAALGGGMAGAALSAGILFQDPHNLDVGKAAVLFGAPLAGASIGYYLSHKHIVKNEVAIGSLLQLDESGLALGVPMLSHKKNGGNSLTQVSLFSGSF